MHQHKAVEYSIHYCCILACRAFEMIALRGRCYCGEKTATHFIFQLSKSEAILPAKQLKIKKSSLNPSASGEWCNIIVLKNSEKTVIS